MEITEGGKRRVSTGYIPLRADTCTWVAKQNAAQVQVLGHCRPEQDVGLGKEMCAAQIWVQLRASLYPLINHY